jgi:hypothetical protein
MRLSPFVTHRHRWVSRIEEAKPVPRSNGHNKVNGLIGRPHKLLVAAPQSGKKFDSPTRQVKSFMVLASLLAKNGSYLAPVPVCVAL